MIRVTDLALRRGATVVLDRVSVTFERRAMTALVGPSGAGKSTLLRCLNGLDRFDAGHIEIAGVTIGPRARGAPERKNRAAIRHVRRNAGMVFQQYGLFSHMTALENVTEAPVHVGRAPRDEARERARALLESLSVWERRDAYPRDLSGGEQQRVAIARALAPGPEVLLLDEPTSALDPPNKRAALELFADVARRGGTVVVVSHEPELVATYADRTVELHGASR